MKGMVLDAKWEPKPDYTVSDWEKKTGKAITGNAIWHNPTLEVKEWPDPQPGPKEVLLEIQACGVCGSDMHFYETDDDNYILYPGLTKFPTILGHEFSGKVAEVGKEVTHLQPGDMVTVEEMIWCGRCIPCRNGYPNHCTNLEEIGFTIPGAFANYIAVDEKFCWKIDAIAETLRQRRKGLRDGRPHRADLRGLQRHVRARGRLRPGHYRQYRRRRTDRPGRRRHSPRRPARARSPPSRSRRSGVSWPRRWAPTMSTTRREVAAGEVLMELSKGEGFDFHVEAAGVPHLTIPEMEKGLAINGKIVQIGRAAKRVPMYLEAFQVRRAQAYRRPGPLGSRNLSERDPHGGVGPASI